MKNILYPVLIFSRIKWLVTLAVVLVFFRLAASQSEHPKSQQETSTDTTKVEREEAPEKATLRISFDAVKVNDDVNLKAKLGTKVKGRFENIPGVEVNFYKEEIAPGNWIGKSISNDHGIAAFTVSGSETKEGPRTFVAQVSGNLRYTDADNDVTVNPSRMKMDLEKMDSTMTVNVLLEVPDASNQMVPVADAPCQLFVKRLFGDLPIGESANTNEEGQVSFEFPKDIPGDKAGSITIVARFTDHELVGNVEASQVIQWGIPMQADDFYSRRELWSARANSPIPLVIIVNIILIGVWGAIVFIFLEIYRINKLGKAR